MQHLRNIRSTKAILRSAHAVPRRHSVAAAFSTSDSASDYPENEENSSRSYRFEPAKEEGRLTFSLPDLNEREETFLKQQIRIILRPNCLQNDTPPDQDSSEAESNQKISFLNKRDFERVFPPTKGMNNMVACVHQIQKVYPKFKVPRRDTDRYGRNLTRPITAQRVAEGLYLCGVREHHLKQNPDLVLNTSPSYVSESELAEMSETDLSNMDRMLKGSTICRGHFIHNYIQHASKSLNQLGFEEEADAVTRIQFSRFKKSLTLRELFVASSQPVYEAIARRNNFDVNVKAFVSELVSNLRSRPRGPVHLARNFYIYDKILCQPSQLRQSKNAKTFRDFIKPEPLETLITLNASYETLSDLDPRYSDVEKFAKAFVDGARYTVRTPPTNLPVPVRRQMLADIGFDDAEIAKILTNSKCYRYSDTSTNLMYTSPDFVPTMRSRLQILRTEASNLGIISPSDFWGVLTNWASVMQDLAHILDSKETTGSINVTFKRNSKIVISSTESLPFMKKSLPTIKFLAKFFGYTSQDDVNKLMKDTFPTVCFPSVPLHRIHQTLDKLVQRGFTKEQIRAATPLVCFPPSLVEQKLKELQTEQDRDRLLQICLYSIEKEFNFTSDGLFSSSGAPHFSPELKNEIDEYSQKKTDGRQINRRDDDDVGDDDYERRSSQYPPLYGSGFGGSFGVANRTCLQASSRLFSSHSTTASDNFVQKRQFFSGFKGLVLQNPLRWLKVSLELALLQREWDPNFSKADFIAGTKP